MQIRPGKFYTITTGEHRGATGRVTQPRSGRLWFQSTANGWPIGDNCRGIRDATAEEQAEWLAEQLESFEGRLSSLEERFPEYR